MKNPVQTRKIYGHLLVLAAFLLIAFIYCSPVLKGKSVMGGDLRSWTCVAHETMTYNAGADEPTYWTNSIFGGMPTYQIAADTNRNNILHHLSRLWNSLPFPVGNIFIYLVGAYILLLCMKLKKWTAFAGSIALSLVSYNFIILVAGHVTKAAVIGYAMPLVGSIWLLLRGNRWWGAFLTAVFLGLAIANNHLQILYYTLFIALGLGIVELVYAFREKTLKDLLARVGLGLAALVLAVGLNAPALFSTYQYSKATMRGESNGLTREGSEVAGHGLDKEYITAWSYGVDETMTLLIPDFKGGSSGGCLSEKSSTAATLKAMGVPDVKNTMKEFRLPLYWGTQPFTEGPVYLGAIVCFLFVLGIFVVERRIKWWLLSVTVLTLMLSWGHNFMPLTDFFIDYVPLYNKFRTVSMILVATCLCMGLLAILALDRLLRPETDRQKLLRGLNYAFCITGGLCLLFWLVPSLAGSFTAPGDAQFQGDYGFLMKSLPVDRMSLLRHDALRSFLYIVLAFGLFRAYLAGKLKAAAVCVLLPVLLLADMWTVDKRYLNDGSFVPKRAGLDIRPSKADRRILEDKSYYRVLDATVNIFNDARPAYFHKLIGGYHAAKLSRYQELVEYHLQPEISLLLSALGKQTDAASFAGLMKNMGVLNMLNMKYLICNPEAAPLVNPEANGNAWFVDRIRLARNADEEMRLLGEIDTRRELVADAAVASDVPAPAPGRDTAASIILTDYAPNRLVYRTASTTDQVAVFSEIYYKDGWNAYVDGQKMPYFRADYLLRAMPLKAGEHEVEFRFEPSVISVTMAVSLVSSILLLAALGVLLYFRSRKA